MILNESQAIWLLLFIKQHVSTIGWKSSSGFLNNSLKIIKDMKRIIQNNIGTEINCVLWSSLSITIFPLSITIFIVMFNLHFNNNKQKHTTITHCIDLLNILPNGTSKCVMFTFFKLNN